MSYSDLNRLLDAKFYKTHMKCSKKQGIIFAENNEDLDRTFLQYNQLAAKSGSEIRRKFTQALKQVMTPVLFVELQEEVKTAKAERAREKEEAESKEPESDEEKQTEAESKEPESDEEKQTEPDGDQSPQDGGPSSPVHYTADTLPGLHSSLSRAMKEGLLVIPGHEQANLQLVNGRIEVRLDDQ